MKQINWEPFQLAPGDSRGDPPRSIDTDEGIGDRLRSAAFAEAQAQKAFLWASEFFPDASPELKLAWRKLAEEEKKHLGWLLARMADLGFGVKDRLVSDHLWISLISCKSAEEFAIFMANAEERGRKAGVRFHQALAQKDPITAEIFRKIAEEEVSHIALAEQFFPAHSLLTQNRKMRRTDSPQVGPKV